MTFSSASTSKPMLALNDIVKKARHLKPTATVVRNRNGNITIEREDLFSSNEEKQSAIKISKEAGKIRREHEEVKQQHASQMFPQYEGDVYEFYYDEYSCNDNFDHQNGCWMVARQHSNKNESNSFESCIVNSGNACANIRIATYNVWFSQYKWKERLNALCDLLLNVEIADIVCLQEVTSHFLKKLLNRQDIRKFFFVTDDDNCSTIGPYGVIMLIRKSTMPTPPNITWLNLPTNMGRKALMATFNIGHMSVLNIVTVHLESLRSKELRTKQLQIINNALDNNNNKHHHDTTTSTCIVLGDLNISSTGPWADENENNNLTDILLPGYEDLWITNKQGVLLSTESQSNGYTFDSGTNAMLALSLQNRNEPLDRSRYDRVLLKTITKASNFNIDGTSTTVDDNTPPTIVTTHGMKIIGNNPIGPDVFISDHFGLQFDLNIASLKNS